MLRFFVLFTIIILSSCVYKPFKQVRWTHLELGAGNYGKDGHTKKSQRRTVLKEFKYVSKSPNYIDELPEADLKSYNPKYQYAILFWTLDELVKRNGKTGIFHVNDLIDEYAKEATLQLKLYAKNKNYTQIIIEPIVGDYTKISPKVTLAPYRKSFYDSVHLKNPEVSLFNYGMDGDKMLSNHESRKIGRDKLQKLANLSSNGLYLFMININDNFIPKLEKEEFIDKNIFYFKTDKWDKLPYYFPEGVMVEKALGNVFFIKSNYYNETNEDY
ncbi:MAG: hypothetical protein J0H68_07005 [Sphingobacteriia bacterium]|nr:hypothetical protein [Sphingobacteriia bacterium]